MSTTANTRALGWYAMALAAVHHYRLASMEDIASHLCVTLAEWVAIDRAWTAAIGAPGPLPTQFALLFAQARKRLLDGHGPALRDVPAYLRTLRPSREDCNVKADETMLLAASASGPVLPFTSTGSAAAPTVPPTEELEGHSTATLSVFVPVPVLPFAGTEGRETPHEEHAAYCSPPAKSSGTSK